MNPVLDAEGLAKYHQLLKSKELGAKANKSAGVFYIEGTGDTAGVWLGAHSDISEYYPGLMIAYKPSIAGATGVTLNINGLGAVSVVRNVNTAVTTHYGIGSVVFLVYTVDDSGTAYWKVSDYDSDTKTRSSNKTGSKMYIIGATTQSTSGQTTYSNSNCYIGTDNCLYSGGKKVLNSSDTAAKASQLATARTIALSGDATGSAKFDGSGDVTLDVTVSGGGATGDSLNGNVITAALPISAGDIVAFGMHIVNLETEELVYGYMPLSQCHMVMLTHPILGAVADIAQGETSEKVSMAGKFPVSSIQNISLEVGEPVFLRAAPGTESLTVKGYTAMFEIYSQMMPEAFEGVTYDGPNALTQWSLSEYHVFETSFIDPANLYILLGHAISESEIMLSPSHPSYLDAGGTLSLYADAALCDDMGRVISNTYATKSEAGGSYTLPTASSTTLGGVKIGSNITNSSGTISVSKSNVTSALGYTPVKTVNGVSSNSSGAVTVDVGVKTVNGTSPDSSGNVTISVSGGSSADSLKSTGGTFNGSTVLKAATSSASAIVGSAYPVESGKVVVFGNSDTLHGSSAGAGLEISESDVSIGVTSSDGKSFGVTVSSSTAGIFASNGSNYNMLLLSPTAAVPETLKGKLVVSVNGVKADANGNVAISAGPEITYGTTDLTAGSSALTTGSIYLMYE